MVPQEMYINVPRNCGQGMNRYQRISQRNPGYQESHDDHIMCRKCAKKIYLGETAFKFYLLISWCAGLGAVMATQNKYLFISIFFMIYLVSQIIGLLATLSRVRKIFIPYCIILGITTFTNILLSSHFFMCITLRKSYQMRLIENFEYEIVKMLCSTNPIISFFISILCLIFNILCLLSVQYQCHMFKHIREIEQRRRRELLIRNTILYERLIALNQRERDNALNSSSFQSATNADSPPKYSSLSNTSKWNESPPPKYSDYKKLERRGNENVSKCLVFNSSTTV